MEDYSTAPESTRLAKSVPSPTNETVSIEDVVIPHYVIPTNPKTRATAKTAMT